MLRSPLVSRLASRQIRADGARSALIIALIALPIALAVAAMMLIQSGFPTREQKISVTMGTAKTLLVSLQGADGKCLQTEPDSWYCKDASASEITVTPKLNELAEPGSASESFRKVTQLADGIERESQVVTVDLANGLLTGRWQPAELPGPNEVLATPDGMRIFGLQVGDTVRLDGKDYQISAEARRNGESETTVFNSYWEGIRPRFLVGPGHPLASTQASVVFLDREVSQGERDELNRRGAAAITRQALLAQPSSKNESQQPLTILVALAEVVLFLMAGSIVGAAFTVNIRNQQRSLALLSATGATVRTVRGTVLRMGLFLGLIGSVLGALVGLGLGWLLFGVINQRRWFALYGPNWPLLETLGLAAIGVAVTLLVAWLSSRGALKADVLASLRSSRAASKPPRRPWLAMVFGLLSAVLLFLLWWVGKDAGWRSSTYSALLLIGIGAGLSLYLTGVLAAGWLLHRLSATGWGPLAWRIALRDADRNRGRTVATVVASASAALLAVLPLMLAWLAQQVDYQLYRPGLPPKLVSIKVNGSAFNEKTASEVIKSVESVIGSAAGVTKISNAKSTAKEMSYWLGVQAGRCSSSTNRQAERNCEIVPVTEKLSIGDQQQLRFLLGGVRPEIEAAFASGSVVVFQPQLVTAAGQLEVDFTDWSNRTQEEPKSETKLLPGIKAADLPGIEPMISAATAAKLGLEPELDRFLIRSKRELTPADRDALTRAVMKLGYSQSNAEYYLSLDVGPRAGATQFMLPLGLAGAAVILLLAILGMALSVRDGEVVRLALVNIGAKRSTLRRVVAVQAIFATTVGVLIGTSAAILPLLMEGIALEFSPLSLPWPPLLLLLAIPIPLVALGAALLVKPEPARVIREV